MAITTTTWEYDDDDGEMSALMMLVLRGGPPHYRNMFQQGQREDPHQLRRRLAWVVRKSICENGEAES